MCRRSGRQKEDLDGQPEEKKTKADDDEEPTGQTGGSCVIQPLHFYDRIPRLSDLAMKTLNLLPSFPFHLLVARMSKGDSLHSVYLTNDTIKGDTADH